VPDEWLEHGLPPNTDPRRFTFVIVCNHCKARKTTLQDMRQHFKICPNKTSHPDLTCGHCRYTTQSWASKPTWDAFGKAVSSSAPAPAEGGGGQGSCGSLLTVVSLGATGDRLDPVSPHQEGHMSYMQDMELPPHHHVATSKPLSDSGIPGGPPPVAAAVGELLTSSAARRPSTPRPPATSRNLTLLRKQSGACCIVRLTLRLFSVTNAVMKV